MDEKILDEVLSLTVIAEMFGWDTMVEENEDKVNISLIKGLTMISVTIIIDGKCYVKTIGKRRFQIKENYEKALPLVYNQL